MRDIAEQLAFLAVKVLKDDFDSYFDDQREVRRRFAEQFEYLLNNLPEGTIK